jgi:hypothetical protein
MLSPYQNFGKKVYKKIGKRNTNRFICEPTKKSPIMGLWTNPIGGLPLLPR